MLPAWKRPWWAQQPKAKWKTWRDRGSKPNSWLSTALGENHLGLHFKLDGRLEHTVLLVLGMQRGMFSLARKMGAEEFRGVLPQGLRMEWCGKKWSWVKGIDIHCTVYVEALGGSKIFIYKIEKNNSTCIRVLHPNKESIWGMATRESTFSLQSSREESTRLPAMNSTALKQVCYYDSMVVVKGMLLTQQASPLLTHSSPEKSSQALNDPSCPPFTLPLLNNKSQHVSFAKKEVLSSDWEAELPSLASSLWPNTQISPIS